MINKIYSTILAFFIGILFSINTQAQQDAQFSHYMFNPTSVNPAYAGYRDSFSFLLLHRSQWMKVDGMPTTQYFTVHSPLKNNQIGMGFNLVNDKLGPANEIYANADFSYSLRLKGSSSFTFGLKGGFHILNVDLNALQIQNENDTTLLETIDNKFLPQIGAGVLYRTSKLYLGMSIPNILESTHYDSTSSNYIAKERINYYFSGGYFLSLNDHLKLQPAFQVKMLAGAPAQVDVSANLMFNDKLGLGAAYRLSSAVSGLVSYRLNKSLLVGIAYDYDTTKFSQISPGSYEFILRYEIADMRKVNRILNPRFF